MLGLLMGATPAVEARELSERAKCEIAELDRLASLGFHK